MEHLWFGYRFHFRRVPLFAIDSIATTQVYVLAIFAHFLASIFIAMLRLLRLMRFIRYFSISDRLKIIADTFIEVIPTGVVQFTIVLLWYYGYSEIAMFLFGGKLVRTNDALKGTDYDLLNFYDVANYNNIFNSFLTQYHLTVVNNWHVTMKGAIAVTNRFACIYFIVFWLLTIIILMNLVVATVLDIFSNQIQHKRAEDIKAKRREKEERERQAEALNVLAEQMQDMQVPATKTDAPVTNLQQEAVTINEQQAHNVV